MGKQLEIFDLSNIALDYCSKTLKRGKTLAENVFQSVKENTGRIWTKLPADITSEEKARKFEEGGILASEERDNWLILILLGHLKRSTNHCIIFEESLGKPSDPFIMKSSSKKFTYGQELYHYVNNADMSPEKLKGILKLVGRYPFIGYMCVLDEKIIANILNNRVTADTLMGIAQSVLKIIIGAYDEESYLIMEVADK